MSAREQQPIPWPVLCIWLCGALSASIYLFSFTFRFPLLELYYQLFDIGGLTDFGHQAAVQYLISILALFGVYILAWRVVRYLPFAQVRLPIYVIALVCGLITALMYPVTAVDVYAYLVHGRGWTVHELNPLIVPPVDYPPDRVFNFPGGIGEAPAPYGPLWLALAGLPSLIAGDSLLGHLIGFKVLSLLFHLGCVACIAILLGQLSPNHQAAGTLLFAWNPLLMTTIIGNGHNDAVMTFFVLVAIATAYSRWQVFSVLLATAAVLVKYTALLFVPILVLWLFRSQSRPLAGLRLAVAACLLGGLAAVVLFLPFWVGLEQFEAIRRQQEMFIASPALLLIHLAGLHAPMIGPEQIRTGLTVLFGLFFLGQLWGVVRTPRTWLMASFEVAFALMFVLSWFNTWYLVWPLALAALSPSRLSHGRMIVFTFTGSFGVLLFSYLGNWQPMLWERVPMVIIAIAGTFLPPLIASLWGGSVCLFEMIYRSNAIPWRRLCGRQWSKKSIGRAERLRDGGLEHHHPFHDAVLPYRVLRRILRYDERVCEAGCFGAIWDHRATGVVR